MPECLAPLTTVVVRVFTVNKSVRVTLAAALLAGAVAAATGPAGATGSAGDEEARAAVLRTELDVGLLNRSVDVPLSVTLNAVEAPRRGRDAADGTRLTTDVEGASRGGPVELVTARTATAEAVTGPGSAWSRVAVADARVRLPGLPMRPLIEAEKITAASTCPAGKRPTARANVLGAVTVLGERVTLTAGGPTTVTVPGVGEVRLRLSETATGTRTAAATALRLSVSVDPLDLGVARVDGTVLLAETSCRAPRPAGTVVPQTGAESKPVRPGADAPELAETGGDDRTPYLVGGAVLLVVLGGGMIALRRTGAGRRG
jgi:hypothetical protein